MALGGVGGEGGSPSHGPDGGGWEGVEEWKNDLMELLMLPSQNSISQH